MSRFENPWAAKPVCATCTDARFIEGPYHKSEPCPVCGCSCEREKTRDGTPKGPVPGTCPGCVKLEELKVASYRTQDLPELTEADLTEKEREKLRAWRALYPRTSTLTMLGWIEGGRYVPEKDREFQKQLFVEIGKWHAHRDAQSPAAEKKEPHE